MSQPFDAILIGNTQEDRDEKAKKILELAENLELEIEYDRLRMIIIIKIPNFDRIEMGA